MGAKREMSFLLERRLRVMDLVIETLQGTAFELTVSPFDTILDVKARICKVEGIPVSQQHLVWNSQELNDECSLQDYNIQEGATLKLLPNMRVGPINTRRVAVEDSYLRDYAECLNRDEILERLQSSARPLTVIIYNNGDQINFYRVVDRPSASPSLSNGSGCLDPPDDEEENKEVHDDEQDRTREKMREIRAKMESLQIEKNKRRAGGAFPATSAPPAVATAPLPPVPVPPMAPPAPLPPSSALSRRGPSSQRRGRKLLPPVEGATGEVKSSELLPPSDPIEALLNRARVKVACNSSDIRDQSSRSSSRRYIRDSESRLQQLRLSGQSQLRLSGQSNRRDPTLLLPPMNRHEGKKKSKRCGYCNKKTGLANSFTCRCGVNFCSIHRYAEIHGCTFDYKSEGRRLLEQNNPVVTAPKLPKI